MSIGHCKGQVFVAYKASHLAREVQGSDQPLYFLNLVSEVTTVLLRGLGLSYCLCQDFFCQNGHYVFVFFLYICGVGEFQGG